MKIIIKPLSVNDAWQGKRFKSKAYKAYENEIIPKLPELKVPNCNIELEITFGFSNSASDIDNPAKPFIDCLQKKYKFNDNQIYKLVLYKEIVKKGEEFINFDIKEF